MKKNDAGASAPETSPSLPTTPASSRRRVRKPSPTVASVLSAVEAAVVPEPVVPQVQPAALPVSVVSGKKKKKPKVVRDSFTMPESDYEKIAELKKKSLEAGISIKKSELLRAGLHALEALPIDQLKALLGGVENIKTGRPASEQSTGTTLAKTGAQ